MKIIHQNLKRGEIKLKAENLDDLWYLSNIVEPHDNVRGQTERKIKLGKQDERRQKIVKKKITLAIDVEKTEFAKNSDNLRISGTITQGPEDIPRGQYHTITVEENSIITITKQQWLSYQLEKLKEAQKPLTAKILIAVFDREEAHFALLKRQGYSLLSTIQGDVQKKFVTEKEKQGKAKTKTHAAKESFWHQIIKQLGEYDKRYSLNTIILASPAFWKEELQKELKDDELKKKMISATCSSADKSAINEVLKRQETQQALKQDRLSKELALVEKLLAEISKKGNYAYGLDEVSQAADAGAVEELLVSDNIIRSSREQDNYQQIDNIMKKTEQTKGNINIIYSENEPGKKLDGLGGIGALLRYKLNY